MQISITWSTEDVLARAKELDVPCSEAEAEKVLMDIEKYYDANHGITWDTIDTLLI